MNCSRTEIVFHSLQYLDHMNYWTFFFCFFLSEIWYQKKNGTIINTIFFTFLPWSKYRRSWNSRNSRSYFTMETEEGDCKKGEQEIHMSVWLWEEVCWQEIYWSQETFTGLCSSKQESEETDCFLQEVKLNLKHIRYLLCYMCFSQLRLQKVDTVRLWLYNLSNWERLWFLK